MNEPRVTKKQFEDYQKGQEIARLIIQQRMNRLMKKATWQSRVQMMMNKQNN